MHATFVPIFCSSVSLLVASTYFATFCWRVWYEYNRVPLGNLSLDAKPRLNNKLLLNTSISLVFTIIGVLLFVFSLVGSDGTLQLLLLLSTILSLAYQGGIVWLYCDTYLYCLRWPVLGLLIHYFIASVVLAVLATRSREAQPLDTALLPCFAACPHETQPLDTALLSCFAAEYTSIGILYLIIIWKKPLQSHAHFRSRTRWHTGVYFLTSAGAFTTLVLYLKGNIDVELSLWTINQMATVCAVQWLVISILAIQNCLKGCEMNSTAHILRSSRSKACGNSLNNI